MTLQSRVLRLNRIWYGALLLLASVVFGLSSAALQTPEWSPHGGWQVLWGGLMLLSFALQLLALAGLMVKRRR